MLESIRGRCKMNYHNIAMGYDGQKNYLTAAYYYELAVMEERTSNSFIDLAVFYFQFTDIGINAASQLPLDFISTAFARYDLVLDRGIDAFPSNSEMLFWRLYFRHRAVYYDDLSESDVLSILDRDGSSLVPYFFLYLLEPTKYENERQKLLRICRTFQTSKSRWILSLIESPAIDFT